MSYLLKNIFGLFIISRKVYLVRFGVDEWVLKYLELVQFEDLWVWRKQARCDYSALKKGVCSTGTNHTNYSSKVNKTKSGSKSTWELKIDCFNFNDQTLSSHMVLNTLFFAKQKWKQKNIWDTLYTSKILFTSQKTS